MMSPSSGEQLPGWGYGSARNESVFHVLRPSFNQYQELADRETVVTPTERSGVHDVARRPRSDDPTEAYFSFIFDLVHENR